MTLREIANKVLDTPLQSFLPTIDWGVVFFFLVLAWGIRQLVDEVSRAREKKRWDEKLKKADAQAKLRNQKPAITSL